LIHKIAYLYQRTFDDIAAAFVTLKSLADRIGDVAAVFGEFAQESDFVRMLRKKKVDQAVMVLSHGEDMTAALKKFFRYWLAAEALEVDPELRQGIDGRLACLGAFRGIHPRGKNSDIPTVPKELFHEALRHGASATVSCTDEQDGFHEGLCARCKNRDIKYKL
jgi:hypothetical protein